MAIAWQALPTIGDYDAFRAVVTTADGDTTSTVVKVTRSRSVNASARHLAEAEFSKLTNGGHSDELPIEIVVSTYGTHAR